MLTIYRRHRKGCRHRDEAGTSVHIEGDLFSRAVKCSCPLWVDGFLGGQEIRKSLKTRNYEKALDNVRNLGKPETQPVTTAEPMTIHLACDKFLADAKTRQLAESTVDKYRLLFKQIAAFAHKSGLLFLKQLGLEQLDEFRCEWKDGPRSGLKKLERLRAFLRFCERRKWIDCNPALDLKAPKVAACPTLPFTREDMLKTLAAIEKYAERAGNANAQLLRAFVLLLRYSGMRIGDATQCGPARINGNKLFLYTQKTGIPVWCVLPDFLIQALEAAPKRSERFFFWTGKSKLHSIVGKWQRRLGNLFDLAGVQGGHAHRFRDTFAVELLLSGVPLERVSVLLGHQSIRITERDYAPWVRSRQEQLEADLARAWSEDPVALMQRKGTNEVHDKPERPN